MPFVPFVRNGIEGISMYDNLHQNGSCQNNAISHLPPAPDPCAFPTDLIDFLPNQTSPVGNGIPVSGPTRSSSLSQFVHTYQEFIPGGGKQKKDPELKNQKKKSNAAYVPPHLRGKKVRLGINSRFTTVLTTDFNIYGNIQQMYRKAWNYILRNTFLGECATRRRKTPYDGPNWQDTGMTNA